MITDCIALHDPFEDIDIDVLADFLNYTKKRTGLTADDICRKDLRVRVSLLCEYAAHAVLRGRRVRVSVEKN